jgi:DNA invertase Pin-like site-specific DNA recombinase
MTSLTDVDAAPTLEDVVRQALALDPRRALAFTNGDQARLCSTGVFTAVRQEDGKTLPLERLRERYGALYVRVSTVGQVDDGYSAEDQIRRGVEFFLAKRQQFRIFSDAGLSGGLAINEPALIRRLARQKASRYEKVFRAIFLHDLTSLTPAQVSGLERYLAEQTQSLLGSSSPDDDWEAEQILAPNVRVRYRPALSLLCQSLRAIHTLGVSDLSRLARSWALLADLSERLAHHRVAVQGLIEPLDYLTSDDEWEFRTVILGKMAEMKLREAVTGSLRGLRVLLQSGRPHSTIPLWVSRDAEGRAFLNEHAPLIRRLVHLVADDKLGMMDLVRWLEAEGIATTRGNARWGVNTLSHILRNRALVGYQEVFGIEWAVFPPLVSEETFARAQTVLDRRRASYRGPVSSSGPARHLLTGLLRCSCEAPITMMKRPEATSEQYRCSGRKSGKTHTDGNLPFGMNSTHAERFFEELMREHPRVVLSLFRDNRERNDLMEEIRTLEAEAALVRERRAAEAESAETRARTALTQSGLPITLETLAAIKQSLLRAFDDEERLIVERIEDRSHRLDTLTPPEAIASLEERVALWQELPVHEKNAILRAMFTAFKLVGPPGEQMFVGALRTAAGQSLPPIRLRCRVWRNGRSTRRFPSVENWIESWGVPDESERNRD